MRHGNAGQTTSSGYRYGYNGKENDIDAGFQDYGFRMLDNRVARFLSLDPLTSKYPYYSPYLFAGDNPVVAVDLDGLEPAHAPAPKVLPAEVLHGHRIDAGHAGTVMIKQFVRIVDEDWGSENDVLASGNFEFQIAQVYDGEEGAWLADGSFSNIDNVTNGSGVGLTKEITIVNTRNIGTGRLESF
ncbi:MAG: hypothetical protein IPP17_28935 [Bacteroidetes bacterium]|nr:hypothetical protein [Bacteroidota bacterium]